MRKCRLFQSMNHRTISILIIGLCGGCSKPADTTDASTLGKTTTNTPPAEYPILVIDEKHQMRGKETPPAYQIAATPGIRIDATQFHFTYGTNPVTPNTVQLAQLVPVRSYYKLSRLTETNFYVIDHTTLETVKGESFRGFRSGDRVMFFIGRSTQGPEKESLWVSWTGQIEVK